MSNWLKIDSRAALRRLAILAAPLFGLWLILSVHVLVPFSVTVQSLWLTPAYSTYEPRIVQTEGEKHWQLETNLFQASQDYPDGTHRPDLQIDSTSSIKLKFVQPLTLSVLVFWLLHLSLSPLSRRDIVLRSGALLGGSLQLLGIVALLVGVIIFDGIEQVVASGEGLIRSYYLDTIMVPRPPPRWLISLLKPVIDAATFFLILVLPVALCVVGSTKDLATPPK